MPLHFEWDPEKATENLRRHGVSFEEAKTVFGDPLARWLPDEGHSEGEQRIRVRGRSANYRLLVVVHVDRGDSIRIISAWELKGAARREYEEED